VSDYKTTPHVLDDESEKKNLSCIRVNNKYQIPNYWLKAIPVTHSYITKIFNTIIEELKQMPDWLTTRITYLLPKWLTTGITYLLPTSEDTKEPKHY
jgi:hypothetical protein